MRLPTVFFAEGGGGRPGDTDYPRCGRRSTPARSPCGPACLGLVAADSRSFEGPVASRAQRGGIAGLLRDLIVATAELRSIGTWAGRR